MFLLGKKTIKIIPGMHLTLQCFYLSESGDGKDQNMSILTNIKNYSSLLEFLLFKPLGWSMHHAPLPMQCFHYHFQWRLPSGIQHIPPHPYSVWPSRTLNKGIFKENTPLLYSCVGCTSAAWLTDFWCCCIE